MGGPCAVFTSLFASWARSTLSKMENEASSEMASARAVVSPQRNINNKSKRPHALTEKSRCGFSILGFMSNACDGECQMVANFLDHRNGFHHERTGHRARSSEQEFRERPCRAGSFSSYRGGNDLWFSRPYWSCQNAEE